MTSRRKFFAQSVFLEPVAAVLLPSAEQHLLLKDYENMKMVTQTHFLLPLLYVALFLFVQNKWRTLKKQLPDPEPDFSLHKLVIEGSKTSIYEPMLDDDF